jgi:YbbR domain-containing protein
VTRLVDLRYAALALFAAVLLWGFSHSTADQERGFDIPVVPTHVPEDMIVVARSSDAVNMRVRGSRGALRRVPVADFEYEIDLTGARPGVTSREVDLTAFDLGRGTQIVSRSPTTLEFTLEAKMTRRAKVKPDVTGEPAEGFVLGEVEVEPRRLLISGAESEVLRLDQVTTETIDVSGATASFERVVHATELGSHAWPEPGQEIRVRVEILPEPAPEPEPEPEEPRSRRGR